MGLRINTNVAALDALRNLNISEANQQTSLQRLSSGLRINTAADDPAGLIISNQLSGQVAALQQDSQNSQSAVNLVSTASDALQNINTLLVQIQGAVQFALNTGGNSPAQIAAEQATVDQAVQAINRVAQTTRYGNLQLLNGGASYQLNGTVPAWTGGATSPGVENINFQSLTFQPGLDSQSLTLSMIANPGRATFTSTGLITSGGATLLITGDRGSAEVQIGAGATATTIGGAINTVADQTGVVYASAAGVSTLASEGFGTSQFVSLQVLTGTVSGNAGFSGGVGTLEASSGTDAQVGFNGAIYTSDNTGINFHINAPEATFQFTLNPNLYTLSSAGTLAPSAGVATLALSVENTGLAFQVRELNTSSDRINVGIQAVDSGSLGVSTYTDTVATAQNAGAPVTLGGFLSSLQTGAGNDLTQNAANAENIVNAAAKQVSSVQGYLGAVVADNVQPNIDSIAVATTNLQASNSTIKDLNFAQESENLAQTQVIFQSGIAALAAAKLLPQSVLQLLH